MAKTAAQRAARRARRKAVANARATLPNTKLARRIRARTVPVLAPGIVASRTRGATKRKRARKSGPRSSIPGVMSSVSDGVNTGMVWKNSNQVRDFFATRFEKVTDLVSAGTAFAIIQQFYLNPGNVALFPVFSQIAATYEEYICHRLRFWYRGEEYTASGTNVSAGIVVYATNMDPDDSNFGSVNQMENYEGSVSGPPFAGHFCHDVDVVHRSRGRNRAKGDSLSLNQYFVYSSNNQSAPVSGQTKFYDMGNFQCAVNGTQAATTGELWVEHSWTMIRRKQQTPLGQADLSAHYVGLATTANAFTALTQRTNSTVTLTLSANSFVIPSSGRWLVAYSVIAGTSYTGTTLGAGTGATAVTIMDGSSSGGLAYGSATTNFASIGVFDVVGSGTIAIGSPTIVGTTNADLFVTQIPGALGLSEVLKTDADLAAKLADLTNRFDRLNRLVNRAAFVELDSPDDIKESHYVVQGDGKVQVVSRPPGLAIPSPFRR